MPVTTDGVHTTTVDPTTQILTTIAETTIVEELTTPVATTEVSTPVQTTEPAPPCVINPEFPVAPVGTDECVWQEKWKNMVAKHRQLCRKCANWDSYP